MSLCGASNVCTRYNQYMTKIIVFFQVKLIFGRSCGVCASEFAIDSKQFDVISRIYTRQRNRCVIFVFYVLVARRFLSFLVYDDDILVQWSPLSLIIRLSSDLCSGIGGARALIKLDIRFKSMYACTDTHKRRPFHSRSHVNLDCHTHSHIHSVHMIYHLYSPFSFTSSQTNKAHRNFSSLLSPNQ